MEKKIQEILKKGQSAVEYVFSYGWALIMGVFVIAATVLILPDIFEGEICTTNSYLAVSGIKSSETDFEIVFVNQTGINIQNVSLTTSGNAFTSQALGTIRAGEKVKTTIDSILPEKYDIELVFRYFDSYNFEKTATINCRGKRGSSQGVEGQQGGETGGQGGEPEAGPVGGGVQTDSDGDGVNDGVDNCINVSNPGQEDLDGDQTGDVCDAETCGNGTIEGSEACDDDNQVDGDRCSSTCQIEYYRAFVTNSTYNGNLGGVSGADSKCQTAAAGNASLNGTWKAWVSVSGNNASARLSHSSVEYRLVDNQTKIADDWSDLTDGALDAPINMSELGQFVIAGSVWTGTDITGTATLSNCLNWSSTMASINGNGGLTSSALSAWTTNLLNPACSSQLRIYCFEQPQSGGPPTGPVQPPGI